MYQEICTKKEFKFLHEVNQIAKKVFDKYYVFERDDHFLLTNKDHIMYMGIGSHSISIDKDICPLLKHGMCLDAKAIFFISKVTAIKNDIQSLFIDDSGIIYLVGEENSIEIGFIFNDREVEIPDGVSIGLSLGSKLLTDNDIEVLKDKKVLNLETETGITMILAKLLTISKTTTSIGYFEYDADDISLFNIILSCDHFIKDKPIVTHHRYTCVKM